MCLATNIVRRGAKYYVRVRVPADLREFMRKEEIWESLRTADPQEAKRRAPAVLMKLHQRFDDERKERDLAARPLRLTTEELQRFARDYYEAELRADEHERVAGLVPGFAELFRDRSTAILRADLGRAQNFVHVHHEADRIMDQLGYQVRPPADEDHDRSEPYLVHADNTLVPEPNHRPVIRRDDPSYRHLCMWLMRAKAEAFLRFQERDRGDFAGAPKDPILRPSATSMGSPTSQEMIIDDGETLAALHERYLAERQDITEEWRLTNHAIMRQFISFIGPRKPVASISKRDVRRWKELLLQFPSRGTLSKPGSSFMELVEANKAAKKPTLSIRTINKYLSALGAFFDWCERNDYVSANPATGSHLSDEKGDDKRDPFTVDQLNALFKSPLFTGCQSDDDGDLHKMGNVAVRDHRYWLPLLALFTGARLGELAQLTIADVQRLDGADVLNINAIGGKRLKTRSSRRVVPIHDELKELGLMRYVQARRERGDVRLFPDIEPDSLGRLSTDYSKLFTKYLRRVGIKTDSRLAFHSFRHSFADALRLAGHSDATVGVILGHKRAGVTASYGSLGEYPPAQRLSIVNSTKFPGLDLMHLRRA